VYDPPVQLLLPPDRGAVRGPARAAVLADWMTAWLKAPVRVEVARSYRELAVAIERAAVDLAWAPPAVCARVRGSARTMLTVVRYGATSCRAALIVRGDAGFRDLRDLAGKRAAWVDPLSTSGHLMALAHLYDNGLDPKRLFASQRFAGSYRDALADVIAGRADVTSFYVVDEGPKLTMREVADLVGSDGSSLSILATTAPAPFDALVVPRSAPDSAHLEAQILALHQRMNPPAMLLEVCRADRFVRAKVEDYARFDRLVDSMVLDA
jgi:phosphonate transport system substrate-binding protein